MPQGEGVGRMGIGWLSNTTRPSMPYMGILLENAVDILAAEDGDSVLIQE
tara:strand:+ start:319 stop:468 length:150 start_codon:yes stop_codon:yes gene_type:complete